MSQVYSYTKPTELNLEHLEYEINHKEGIPCPVLKLWTLGNDIFVEMKDTLSTEAEAALAEAVANHIASEPEVNISYVKILEEPTYAHIDRTMQSRSFEISAATLTSGMNSIQIEFPFPIVVLGGEFHCKDENVKDRCQFIVNPNGIAAVTATSYSIGQYNLAIPLEYLGYFYRGFSVSLTDGVNYESLGRIISVTGSGVQMESPTTMAWSAGTYVILEYSPIPHIYFDAPVTVRVAKNTSSGTYVPENTPMEFRYFNENGITKTIDISFTMEYYF
jgi:hypothetical protein